MVKTRKTVLHSSRMMLEPTHSPEEVPLEAPTEVSCAEVPDKAESLTRRTQSISTVLLGRASDGRNDDLHVSGKGDEDGLNGQLSRRCSGRPSCTQRQHQVNK